MTTRTRIKICGITREADLDAAVEAGADAVGFVLYPKSPRAIAPARAAELARRLPPFVSPVLLFVNAEAAEVRAACDFVPNASLQFHGDESPEACNAAARSGQPGEARYLRAVRMRPGVDLLDFSARFSNAQALLLDTHVDGYGGGGKVFDWSLVPPNVPRPLVLSGGLNAANVGEGMLAIRPWAVDVSSGVERSEPSMKGIKDADAIRRFCEAVRRADASMSAQGPSLAT